jgi:hypothetical protein
MSPRKSARDLYELATEDPRSLRRHLGRLRQCLQSDRERENRHASEAARKFAYACPGEAEPLARGLRRLRRIYTSDHVAHRNATQALEYMTDPGESIHTVGNEPDGSAGGNTQVFDAGDGATTDTATADGGASGSGTEVYGEAGPSINFCPNCGTDLQELSVKRFCPGCGTELE